MFGGMDPKKMSALMRQMGIKQEEIEASRVIIESTQGKIVIDNPNVQKITMQGKDSWQITGDSHVEELGKYSDSDVQMVSERTGKSLDEAKTALEASDGDIAAAILSLS